MLKKTNLKTSAKAEVLPHNGSENSHIKSERKLVYLLKVILLMMLCLFNSFYAEAQPCINFTQAAVNEKPTDPPYITPVLWTGNDAKTSSNLGNMEVSVWDGSDAGLGWDDGVNTPYYVPFVVTTSVPDVALVEGWSVSQNADTWFALVVYADGSGYATCDVYEWDLTWFYFSYSSNILSCACSVANDIHIDSHENNEFVIVWDDVTASEIKVTAGYAMPAAVGSPDPPQIYSGFGSGSNCSCQCDILPGSNGMAKPDVTLLYDNGSGDFVFYTYLDFYGQEIWVTGEPLHYTLYSGTSANDYMNPLFYNTAGECIYNYPRISSPVYPGTVEEWSVVVMKNCFNDLSNTYDIESITSHSSVINDWIVTDGSVSGLCAINTEGNKLPVVSYDNAFSGIMIGWICEYSQVDYYNGVSGVYFNEQAPIAVALDIDGYANSSCYASLPQYMIVPTDNLSVFPVLYDFGLSISGRKYNVNNSLFYTFYNSDVLDIQYKDVEFCNANFALRKSESASNISIFPNPFTDKLFVNLNSKENIFHVCLSDVTGKILIDVKGMQDEINSRLKDIASQLESGMYMVRLESETTHEALNKKLLKM